MENENQEVQNNELNEKIEKLQKALNEERTLRKQAEKKAKEDEDDSKDVEEIKQGIRAKLKAGKAELADDVIEDLLSAFGDQQAKAQLKSQKKEFETEIMELKRDPMYMDIDEYKKEIRELNKKGLSIEQAYWAVAGATKGKNITAKKQAEDDKKAKSEENKERAKQGFINSTNSNAEVGEGKNYSDFDKFTSNKLRISLEEAHARSNSFTLDDILANNKKFSK